MVIKTFFNSSHHSTPLYMVTFFANLREDCPQHINMKMKSAIFVLTLFICTYSKATISAVPNIDSLKKPWHINQEQFIEKYGKDDSSRALIRYYFQRRKAFKKAGLISASIAGVSGILFQLLIMDSTVGSALGSLALGIPLMLLLWGFGIATLFLIVKWLKMSRRYLFKLIKKYNAGKGIPKRMTSQLLFQKFLEEEKHN